MVSTMRIACIARFGTIPKIVSIVNVFSNAKIAILSVCQKNVIIAGIHMSSQTVLIAFSVMIV